MVSRDEIRKAHDIVDGIDSVFDQGLVRKLLPPRPEKTFRETINDLKGMASEDDIHLWKIIGRLEGFEKRYSHFLGQGSDCD